MPGKTSLLLSAGLSLVATLAQAQATSGYYSTINNATSSACPGEGGAHLIVARASQEPLGYGTIGMTKDKVIAANPASNAEYVVYPATLADYFNSESAGVEGMKELVDAYIAKDCPNNAPIVLMGYSQGAQVVADYLSGQSVKGFPYNATFTEPASEDVLSRVAAVITMGDPSINITNNAAHVGNSTKGGLFERAANSSMVLDGIACKYQAYCDALDPYCASADNFDHIQVHLNYVPEYGMDAVQFVSQKVEAYYAGASGGANGTSITNGTAGAGASPTNSGDQPAYAGAAPSMRAGSAVALVMAMGIALVCGI